MKVYVDELPKSCNECGFCCRDDLGCWCQGSGECGVYIANETIREKRLQSCPLKFLAEHDKQVRKEVVGELIVDIRSLFNSYASSLIDYCTWNKNAEENQKLYNNFKRIINDRLKKVLELFDKRIDQIQGDKK